MIKTLIILALLVVAAGGAFLSKPSKENFQSYYSQQSGSQPTLSVKGLESTLGNSMYLNSIVYHDHVLWATIERNGIVQYTGAFGHWFKSKAATT